MSAPGFQSYDLRDFRAWPEFHALSSALDDFLQRAGRELEVKQVDGERAIAALARNMVAADCCPHCRGDGGYDAYPPYQATVDRDGNLQAVHRCKQGHEWPCWWASREAIVELG